MNTISVQLMNNKALPLLRELETRHLIRLSEPVNKTKNKHSISYSPEFIISNNRKYIFNYPILSLFQKESDHFIIKNELLDIYAVGKTENEVETDFNEEFDYLFQRLNSLKENEISTRLNTVKIFINHYVKEVIADGNR